jgi:hypothetical protein
MNSLGYLYVGAVLGAAALIAWQRISSIDERLRTIEGDRLIVRLNERARSYEPKPADSAKG